MCGDSDILASLDVGLVLTQLEPQVVAERMSDHLHPLSCLPGRRGLGDPALPSQGSVRYDRIGS